MPEPETAQAQPVVPPQMPIEQKSVSQTTPTLVGIIVVVVIVFLGFAAYYAFLAVPKNASQSAGTYNKPATTRPPSEASSTMSGTTGNSDAQLDQDSQAVDNSLSSFNNDLKNVDQGLNDQQLDLSE